MSLRDQMPVTAAFIDQMRTMFGQESVDAQIRAGLRGEPMFWAREGGVEIGTKPLGDRVLFGEGAE
jgi:hypothetical protein